jgi:hypothetical protein
MVMNRKTMRIGSVSLVGAALMLALGCSSEPQSPAGPIAGQWVSTFSSQFVDLVLEEQNGEVRGRAELLPGDGAAPYEVSGTFGGAELNASLRKNAAAPITLRGTLRRDTLTIVLNGGEFSNRSVPLVRQ